MAVMKKRVAIITARLEDGDRVATLEKGKEYLTSKQHRKNLVRVYSSCWFYVPRDWFK